MLTDRAVNSLRLAAHLLVLPGAFALATLHWMAGAIIYAVAYLLLSLSTW